MHSHTTPKGNTLALASCPDLTKLDIDFTKIIASIPIKDQQALVQELSSNTLAQDTYEMRGNKTKSAFFQFITFDSNAAPVQRLGRGQPMAYRVPQ